MSLIATARRLRHGPLKPLGSLWVVLGRLFRASLSVLPLDLTVSHRIGAYGPFRLDGHFAFSDFEHWGGVAHNRGFEACIEAARGRHCMLDVGGHIGLVSLPVSRVLAPGGRVFAFEPARANLRYLKRHIALNAAANIEVVEALVGAEPRDAVAFFEQAGPTGQNSVLARDGHRETTRPQITLDTFCNARALRPEVVKIDVEGAEIDVLQGARETLRRHRPLVFLSVHPRHLRALGRDEAELHDCIAALGYRCLDMDGQPVERFALDEYRLEPMEESTRDAA